MRLPHADYSAFSVSDGVATLRAWSNDDAAFIVTASTDPAIQRYSAPHDQRGRPDPPPTIADASRTIAGFAENWQTANTTGELTGVGFALTEAMTDKLVGQCGIDQWSSDDIAQIGYWLAPDARGNGFATRAVILLTNWLFEHDAARVFMTIVADNQASVAVARRAGFVHERTVRNHDIWQDRRHDVSWFAARADAWKPT